jgi:LuxR family transcriptional regulator, maltose regulon positive regulatory protein
MPMSGSAGATPAPTGRAMQFGPPNFAFEAVASRALQQLLAADPFPRVVTAVAPPGYGKTVLLSSLCREFLGRGQACLWLALDDRDADLSSLLYRLRTVLAQAGVSLPDEKAGAQVAFHDPPAPVDNMLRLLKQLPATTLLFIDNLGFCTDPALGPFLSRLLFGPESGLRLVLSSTDEMPFDTLRAKLELGALEFRARHLSFDRAGTATLLQQAGIALTSAQDLDRIVAQTEGWPAAVRLLQVLLVAELGAEDGVSGAADIASVLQRFSGDQADMARVLTQRVLVRFDPEIVRFMVEISLLREFNVDLAAHMTGQAAARQWLDMLVSRNVLTFPLDSRRRWFRFHTLMREFLLAEAGELLSSARRRELLERAAHWHKDRGDNVAAIDIALEAGATTLAQEILDRIARVVVGGQGQMRVMTQWVDRLAQAGIEPSLEAQAWYVWALCDSLHYERARLALDAFDRRVAADPALAGAAVAQTRLMFLRMLLNVFIDRLDTAYDQATAWLAQGESGDELTTATVISIAGIAEIDRGELSAARLRMERARSVIDRSDSAYGLAWVCILRACVEIGQARPGAADALLTEGRAKVADDIGNDASVVVTLDFVHARALLDLGRTAVARELASNGLARAMNNGIVGSLEHGLVASVAFWGESGDDAIHEAQLDRVANCYPSRGPRLLAASKVRRLLALGRQEDAHAVATSVGLGGASAEAGGAPMRERGDWLLARLELQVALGASEAVLGEMDALLKTARTQGRERDRIELLLVAADAQHRLGQNRMALRHLSMAVILAAPGKLLLPFQVHQSLLSRLLVGTDTHSLGLIQPAERAFFERLRAQDTTAAATHPSAAEAGGASTVDVLTQRQIQLLALLDEGLNNEQVADRLALSVPTVKWHLHNAYVKLGVRSRSAALARARALKLLGR